MEIWYREFRTLELWNSGTLELWNLELNREDIRLIGQLSTVGLSFVLAIVMGFGGGYLLDGWLGTRPWLTFLGFIVGIAAGITNVYRVMKLANPPPRPPSENP